MENSHSDIVKMECSKCDEIFDFRVWILVDINERPDLLVRILQQTLHQVECPKCSFKALIAAPLLIYWSDAEYPLIFSPSISHAEQQLGKIIEFLLKHLKNQLGPDEFQRASRTRIVVVPRQQLVSMLTESTNEHGSDIKTTEQLAPSRNTSDTKTKLAEIIKKLAPLDPEPTKLINELATYLDARTMNEISGLFAVDSELQTELAEKTLQDYVRVLEGSLDDRSVALLRQRLLLLRFVRLVGYEVAYKLVPTLGHAHFTYDSYQVSRDLKLLDMVIEASREAIEVLAPYDVLLDERLRVLHNLGMALRERFGRKRQQSDLDQAIIILRQVLAEVPHEFIETATFLNNLGRTLWMRYATNGQVEDLNEAITLFERAIPLFQDDAPDLPQCLVNLGICLEDRFNLNGQAIELNLAIQRYEEAVAKTPRETIALARNINSLALSLALRYDRVTADLDDLNKSVQLHKQAIEVCPPSPQDLQILQGNLINRLEQHYAKSEQPQVLDNLIDAYRSWFASSKPRINPQDLLRFSWLGTHRYHFSSRSPADRHQIISDLQMVIDAFPSENQAVYSLYAQLGLIQLEQYKEAQQTEILEAAIVNLQKTLEHSSSTDLEWHRLHAELGFAFDLRYRKSKQLSDLQSSVTELKEAVRLSPQGEYALETYLITLTSMSLILYDANSQVEALADCQSSLSMLSAVITPNSHSYLAYLDIKSRVLFEQYMRTSDVEMLDSAIRLCREAIDNKHAESAKSSLYTHIALCLRARYEIAGQLDDLQEAISYLQRGLESERNDEVLSALGTLLRMRYQVLRELSDLQNAIHLEEEALKVNPPGAPERAHFLTGISNSLFQRYLLTGDLYDLDRAISGWQEAVSLIIPGEQAAAVRHSNLGDGLQIRFARSNDPEDLAQSIYHHRTAVTLTPPQSPELPRYLSFLSSALLRQFYQSKQLNDLEEAIQVTQQGMQLTTLTSQHYTGLVSGLGQLLYHRYEVSGQETDLHQAKLYISIAIERASYSGIDPSGNLYALGQIERDMYDKSGKLIDLEAASKAFRAACEGGLKARQEVTLSSSLSWGLWAVKRTAWLEAVEAFSFGLESIRKLYEAQVLREHKEAWLSEAQSIPAFAAYALAKTGDLIGAVTAIEQGRARLLTEALDRDHHTLERLKTLGYDEIYNRYKEALQRLSALESIEMTASSLQAQDLPERLRVAHTELESAVKLIRTVPGFESMFEVPSFDVLKESIFGTETNRTHAFAAIYLATIDSGSVALVLNRNGIDVVWLECTGAELNRVLMPSNNGDSNIGYLYAQLGHTSIQRASREVSIWLGERILGPIADHLELIYQSTGLSTTEIPLEVILIPTGVLTLLPLHAARCSKDEQEFYFLDRYTVSYAPSGTVLGACRQTVTQFVGQLPDSKHTLLAIGDPQAPSFPPLPYADVEANQIASLFHERAALYTSDKATLDIVIAQLRQVNYAHFACHGLFEPNHPLDSGLILSNGNRLTLRELLRMPRLEAIRLATLSACQTAITDFRHLPNESIGLPTGFIRAGVPGVIGSLWSVDDLSTALLMVRFYEILLESGPNEISPARALRSAQIWLRELSNIELTNLLDNHKHSRDLGQIRASQSRVQGKSEEPAFARSEERPFSDPYYWAGFVFYGA